MKFTIYSRTFVLISFCFSVHLTAEAGYSEPASYKWPKKVITLGSAGFSTSGWDDSWVFQKAINQVASAGGGRVHVPKGNYRVVNVNLKSDVHITVQTGSKITLHKEGVMFNMSGDIANTSIRGIGGRFTMEMPDVNNARGVLLSSVRNALVSNVNVQDPHQTRYPTLGATWDQNTNKSATDISFGNITQFQSNYGYGVAQFQAVTRGTFWNIKCKNGVALRFECGDWKIMTLSGYGGVFDCKANNTTSEQGQAAIMLQPHVLNCGNVFMNGVSAVGSEFAILNEKGGTWAFTADEIREHNLTTGSFGKLSMGNVNAVYWSGGVPTRWSHLDFYPKSELQKIYRENNTSGNVGPSCAVIGDYGLTRSAHSTWNLSKTGAFVNPIISTRIYHHSDSEKNRPWK
ncbi:hypothetical protein EGM51_08470 [Verrucomicrobia bacterium S94]|nr:hypothetical protein EGM51_08470 [Verrucomicrobia bacterium S94]